MEKELRKLYDAFKETDDIYIKGYIWTVFSNFSIYYKNNYEIKKMFDEISMACQYLRKKIKYYDLLEKQSKNEFINANIELINNIPNYFYLFNTKFDKKKHSKEGLNHILESFLNSISFDLLKFYKNIEQEGRIIVLNKRNSDGYTGFSSINDCNNYICINKYETMDDVKVLVHEIGHAYYNYCNNITIDELNKLDLNIKSEVPAILLENLFHIYCRGYNVVKKEKIKIKNYNDLLYLYGMYTVSFLQMGMSEIKIEEVYKSIYNIDYTELMKKGISNKSLVK